MDGLMVPLQTDPHWASSLVSSRLSKVSTLSPGDAVSHANPLSSDDGGYEHDLPTLEQSIEKAKRSLQQSRLTLETAMSQVEDSEWLNIGLALLKCFPVLMRIALQETESKWKAQSRTLRNRERWLKMRTRHKIKLKETKRRIRREQQRRALSQAKTVTASATFIRLEDISEGFATAGTDV